MPTSLIALLLAVTVAMLADVGVAQWQRRDAIKGES
jgi:hypothetical protein